MPADMLAGMADTDLQDVSHLFDDFTNRSCLFGWVQEMQQPTEAMQAARVVVPTNEAALRKFLCHSIPLPEIPLPIIRVHADSLNACIDTELINNIKLFGQKSKSLLSPPKPNISILSGHV